MKNFSLALSPILTILLAACTSAPEIAMTPISSPAPTAPPTASLPTAGSTPLVPTEPSQRIALSHEPITIPGAEGLEIKGSLSAPESTAALPGVLLLHMLGSNRQAWDGTGMVEALVDSGYAVLAVDMRGHGETGGKEDWTLALEDLRRVWSAFTGLETVDPQRTAVIGASIGANMALQLGARIPQIQAAVLLSPGLDYHGVTTADQMDAYGQRPLFIIASDEDTYAANSSAQLADLAQGEAQLQLYNGAGHGTNMFAKQPELAEFIVGWLDSHIN